MASASADENELNDSLIIPVENIHDARKTLHNYFFRHTGAFMTIAGFIGFAPSLFKAMKMGELWSVSHNLPHTKNRYRFSPPYSLNRIPTKEAPHCAFSRRFQVVDTPSLRNACLERFVIDSV